MPTPTQRIGLVVSIEEYTLIKAAADRQTGGNVAQLIRAALKTGGVIKS